MKMMMMMGEMMMGEMMMGEMMMGEMMMGEMMMVDWRKLKPTIHFPSPYLGKQITILLSHGLRVFSWAVYDRGTSGWGRCGGINVVGIMLLLVVDGTWLWYLGRERGGEGGGGGGGGGVVRGRYILEMAVHQGECVNGK